MNFMNEIEFYIEKCHITMPIKRNWKAAFLLWLVAPVKVARLQSSVANLANPLIGGVMWEANKKGALK